MLLLLAPCLPLSPVVSPCLPWYLVASCFVSSCFGCLFGGVSRGLSWSPVASRCLQWSPVSFHQVLVVSLVLAPCLPWSPVASLSWSPFASRNLPLIYVASLQWSPVASLPPVVSRCPTWPPQACRKRCTNMVPSSANIVPSYDWHQVGTKLACAKIVQT